VDNVGGPEVEGFMALLSVRRRSTGILLAGVITLFTVVAAPPAVAGVGTWTSARLYGGTVYCIAASAANPSLVLAGTGGAGVFRSTDGGATWHRSSSGMPHDAMVFALSFAPSAPDTVFAGTYASGVYRSTDAGRTWVRITSGLNSASFFSIAVDPRNAARVFISSGTDLWHTTDGGATWTVLTKADNDIFATAVAIAPSDPQVVYTVGSSMLRSDDGGTTWQDMANVDGATSVLVNPANAYALVVGGLDGVVRSTDGGAAWTPVTTVATNDVVRTLARNPAVPGQLLAGTNAAGLFRSDDGGASWYPYTTGLPARQYIDSITFSSTGPLTAVTLFGVFRRAPAGWTASSTGITGSLVNALAFAPSASKILYAGLQGQGVFRSTDNGASWSYAGLRGRNIYSLAVSPARAATVWAATSRGVWRTRDGGRTWVRQLAVPNDAATAVAVARSSLSTLYVTTFQSGVYRSTDGGRTWHRRSLPAWVLALSVAIDPGNASHLWVGTRYAGIVRSSDGGATWASGTPVIDGYDAVSLCVDPRHHRRLFATIEAGTGGGIFVSSDSGRTWTRATGGTVPNSATVVVADPSTAGRIYAGSNDLEALGVYRSDDDGVTWRNISAGLTTRDIGSLVVQPSGVVHAGTTAYFGGSGGGIFNYTPTR
jgi:photosystem II stability/assembly factor-like uncharacterized protein